MIRLCYRPAFCIEDPHFRPDLCRVHGGVRIFEFECRPPVIHVEAIGPDGHRPCLVKPYVAVDACSLVVPALFRRSVAADGDYIVPTIIEVGRKIVHAGNVSARLAAQIASVAEHLAAAENALELYPYLLAGILRRNLQVPAVPTDRIARILPPDAFVAVGMARLLAVGKVHHPVVGEAHGLPGGVVESGHDGSMAVIRTHYLAIVGEVFRAVGEIALHGGCVAQRKSPVVVQQYGCKDNKEFHSCKIRKIWQLCLLL